MLRIIRLRACPGSGNWSRHNLLNLERWKFFRNVSAVDDVHRIDNSPQDDSETQSSLTP